MTSYFKIEKPIVPFAERKREAWEDAWLITAFLAFCFVVEVIFKGMNIRFGLWFFAILLAICVFISFRKAYAYLQKVEIKESVLRITYFEKNEQFILEDLVENMEVKLVNTASRHGFGCEVVLVVKEKKFVVDSRQDWSLVEIHDLYLFLTDLKGIQLRYKDKANLDIINRNSKKTKNR